MKNQERSAPVFIPLSALGISEKQKLLREAEVIFFETAILKSFESPAERDVFRRRWFGRYAAHFPEAFFLACSQEGPVIGYLAGCLNTFAAGNSELLMDIDYYTPALASALVAYPSHLHINLKPDHQRQGIGKKLIARFLEACRTGGSSGVHVVTGAASPAVAFYEACGFRRASAPSCVPPKLAILTLSLPAS